MKRAAALTLLLLWPLAGCEWERDESHPGQGAAFTLRRSASVPSGGAASAGPAASAAAAMAAAPSSPFCDDSARFFDNAAFGRCGPSGVAGSYGRGVPPLAKATPRGARQGGYAAPPPPSVSDAPERLRENLLGSGWDRRVVEAVLSESRLQDVDPFLVAAVAGKESEGNPRAVSPAGAMGAMQLMPGTARELGVRDAFNPYENVRGGVRYLRQMMASFADISRALMAYNGGPGILDLADRGRRLPRETEEYPGAVLERYRSLKQAAGIY